MVNWSTAHLKVVGVKRNVLLCLQKNSFVPQFKKNKTFFCFNMCTRDTF